MKMSRHEKAIRRELDNVNYEIDQLGFEERTVTGRMESAKDRKALLLRLLGEEPEPARASSQNGHE